MKTKIEEFYFSGDYILELQDEYIQNTVKVYYFEPYKKTPNRYLTEKHPVEVSEVGGKYISLSEDTGFPDRAKIEVEYGVDSGATKLQTNERLKQLEAKVEAQQQVLETVLEALRYRVDIQTFTTWIKSLEDTLGVDIVQQVFTKPYPGGGNTPVFSTKGKP